MDRTLAGQELARDEDAEAAALGAALLDVGASDVVLRRLSRDDFTDEARRLVFDAIGELRATEQPVDGVTVRAQLDRTDRLGRITGQALYIVDLVEKVPVPGHADAYVSLVLRASKARRVARAARDAIEASKRGDGFATEDALRRALDSTSPNGPEGVVLVAASEVRPERMAFALTDRVPLGAVTLLVGDPGLGKSTEATEWAARVTRGQLQGDLEGQPRDAIIATAEDHRAAVVVPRLIAAGADLARVHFVEVRSDGLAEGITLPDDLDQLGRRIDDVEAALLVLDPLPAHIGDGVDTHHDHPVRRVLAPVARLAEGRRVAVVGIWHLNKSPSTNPIHRVTGAIAAPAAARSILLVAPDPNDGEARVLAHAKSNVGPLAPSLRFKIESRIVETEDGPVRTSGIAWEGEVAGLSARDLLAAAGQDEERTARDEACDFLAASLADGPQDGGRLRREARKIGISDRTIDRAKAALGVVANPRRSPDGHAIEGWDWSLADGLQRQSPRGGALEPPERRFRRSDVQRQGRQGPTAPPRVAPYVEPSSAPSARPAETPRSDRRVEVEVEAEAPESEPMVEADANAFVRQWNDAAFEAARPEIEAHLAGRRDKIGAEGEPLRSRGAARQDRGRGGTAPMFEAEGEPSR